MVFKVVAIVVKATGRRPWTAPWTCPSPAVPSSQRTFKISSSASVGCVLGGRAMVTPFSIEVPRRHPIDTVSTEIEWPGQPRSVEWPLVLPVEGGS
jgi:hypothetical protein